ncbi:MAG: protein phosphatase CheZ [Alphaproteobacteria bacterium]
MDALADGLTPEMDQKLQSEVLNLIQYIDRLRREIAGIAQLNDDETAFEGMADRLDAIVTSTADATDTILGAVEVIDNVVDKLREHPDATTIDKLCDQITGQTSEALQACSFQDLTGQRVSKVIGSLRFVEDRVNSMADICGRDQISSVSGEPQLEKQTDDGVAMEGPQSAANAISQDDIDKLFD